MALWTLLVWLLFVVLLGPFLSAALGGLVFRGERVIVANTDLAAWLLRPEGFLYLMLAAALTIVASVVRYTGLFRMIVDDLENRPVSVRQTLFEILPDLPALFKLCLISVGAALVAAIPLVAGLGAIYLLWLAEYDINYYLEARPAEWVTATRVATGWVVLWLAPVAYVLLRILPTLPAYLDGHRPIGTAVRRAWARTRGGAFRVLQLLLLVIATWWLLRAAAQGSLYFVAGMGVRTLGSEAGSLTPLVLITGAYALGSIVVDITLSFFGFTFASTVLTKFYLEDTDLHDRAPAAPAGMWYLPRKAAALARLWIRPRRSVPVLLLLVLLSGGFSAYLLRDLPEERQFAVVAHRAGAFMGPENSLAALERSIAAGSDYAEIDVQRTRDGVVIVAHDADLKRVAGDGRPIATTDYADFADLVLFGEADVPADERRVARLEHFLERSRARIGLMIELKYYGFDPLLAGEVVRIVREYGMVDEVVLISLDLRALTQIRSLAPEITTGYVAAVAAGDLTRLPVGLLAVPRSLASDRLIRSARREGIEVHVWTLNRAETMLEAINRGADGIITDDPELAGRLRTQLGELTAAERLLLRFGHVLFEAEM
jgi:glycerophosphoryl diester phosphodiesterase